MPTDEDRDRDRLAACLASMTFFITLTALLSETNYQIQSYCPNSQLYTTLITSVILYVYVGATRNYLRDDLIVIIHIIDSLLFFSNLIFIFTQLIVECPKRDILNTVTIFASVINLIAISGYFGASVLKVINQCCVRKPNVPNNEYTPINEPRHAQIFHTVSV
jgi:hypothetical protein